MSATPPIVTISQVPSTPLSFVGLPSVLRVSVIKFCSDRDALRVGICSKELLVDAKSRLVWQQLLANRLRRFPFVTFPNVSCSQTLYTSMRLELVAVKGKGNTHYRTVVFFPNVTTIKDLKEQLAKDKGVPVNSILLFKRNENGIDHELTDEAQACSRFLPDTQDKIKSRLSMVIARSVPTRHSQ